LSSLFKGILLIAAQKDANNQVLVLAFSIVRVENTSNWEWFIEQLIKDFPGITVVMADMHKGLDRLRKGTKAK